MNEKSCLIDTDILISILRQEEPVYQQSLDYLEKFGMFKISSISYYECLRGYKSIGAIRKLKIFEKFLEIVDVINLDLKIMNKASEIYSLLKPKGLLKGEFDLLIGSTALAHNLKIVTNNEKHFEPLKKYFDLEIENWMK
jgi:tRNA(fMet)-specific endonuclease VapC